MLLDWFANKNMASCIEREAIFLNVLTQII